MVEYSSADQLLRPGEVALFIFTDGTELKVDANGTGSTGDWVLDPKRGFDWVFIYRRGRRDEIAELIMARRGDMEERADGRFLVNLREVKSVGSTRANWHEFAGAPTNNPIRYIAASS